MHEDRKKTRANLLDALSVATFSRVADANRDSGNALRLLCDGTENYPVWLDAIASAQESIYLENYILEEDAVGQAFADAMIAARRRGVTVRVIYDWLGCRARTSHRFWETLRASGVEIRCYNPPRIDSPLGWISRDHRKLLCVDGRIAFAGGLCIGHDWAGDPARGLPPWRDTAVEVRGPAVAHMEAAFADSWAFTGTPIPSAELERRVSPDAAGNLDVWVVANRPDNMGLYRMEQLVAEVAEKTLWLADAYFVATTGYVQALRGAARNGVDVRILVPGSSNFPGVQALSRAGYRPLLESGVRVFEWNGPMMHAKTAVADGCWARIGSSNSNIASWIANRELDIVVEDENFAQGMEAMFVRDLEGATEITLQSGRVRFSNTSHRPKRSRRALTGKASRFAAGAAGVGSAVGAALSQHRALGPAESRVLIGVGALLAVLALIGIVFPAAIVYPLALIAAWVAITLFIRAAKLRDPEGGPKEQRTKGRRAKEQSH